MSKRAIAITIGSTLLVIALSFLIICTVSFWKMKTQKDTSYQDGFNDGLTEKAELELSVAELRRTNSELTTQLTTITNTVSANERTISDLRASKTALEEQVATLTADNEANSLEITRLTALKINYEEQINGLTEQNVEKQATITQLIADKSALNTQITALQNENEQNEQTISSLQSELSNSQDNNVALQTQIATLQARINQNNLQIAELQSSRAELENRVLDLNASISTNVSTINSLNGQITSLNAQITNLTSANNSNVNTIASLNSQVSVLTNRINELSYTNVEQSNRIVYLNAQIAKLNDYISKYDQFLTGFESETQAIATFELDGSLYNIQLVTNGGYANVDSPANTQYLIFNGWTVNNTIVNLSTYAITQNTKFIADVTHKYDVSFVVDSDVINTQIIAKNGHATAPANPIKSGYTFLGWTINGTTVVDPASVSITDTTTFTALFTQQFTVNFVYDNNTVSTQSIDKGSYGIAPVINNTTYLIFNGWTINGGLVDVATYPITQNTTFVADITYKYDVTFVVDDETVNSQIIVKNGYASVPTAPTKANYEFDGWTIDGTTVVNPLNIAITANTVFTAKFTRLYNVTFTYEETTESAQVVRNGNYANNVTVNSTTYKVFNGWKLNGVIVDVSATPITADTNFVADIIYKYDVIFKFDNADYNTQLVIKDNYATLPTSPTKNGYAFDGWSINGTTIVDPTSIAVTNTITFIAVFTKIHTVTFVYEDITQSTQNIRNGNYATNVTIESTTDKVFNGWKLNGVIVDVSTTPITADTTFVADITYSVTLLSGSEMAKAFKGTNDHLATSSVYPYLARNLVIDNYTSDNSYIVDGVNVIENVTPTTIPGLDNVYLYTVQNDSSRTNDDVYLLSNANIYLNPDCSYMFYKICFKNVYLRNVDTSKVTNMAYMFSSPSMTYSVNSIVCDNWNTSNVTNMKGLLSGCDKLTAFDCSSFDTSKVTDMSEMFYNTGSLKVFDISSFDTSKVTDMSKMFSCISTSIKTLDLSHFNTSNVTDMHSMFSGNSFLTSLNVSSFDTSKVTNMGQMFDGIGSIVTLDLSSFDTSKVTDMSHMFTQYNSTYNKLKTIYVSSSWSLASISNLDAQMFGNCSKLVGGNGTVCDPVTTSSTYNGTVRYAVVDTPSTPGLLTLKTN